MATHLATVANRRQGGLAVTGQDHIGRYGYDPGMEVRPNNIRRLREARSLTLQQLAELTPHATRPGALTDLSTIQKLEKGSRKLTPEWAANIAHALGVQPNELGGVMEKALLTRQVPVLASIAAGNWREAVENSFETIPTTKGGPNTFGLRVDGDSMDLIVRERVVVFVDPDAIELKDGRLYAMMRPDGDTTFKRFRTDPLRLEPCSSNDGHKAIPVGSEALVTLGRVVGAEIDL
jgi:repressor LexA